MVDIEDFKVGLSPLESLGLKQVDLEWTFC